MEYTNIRYGILLTKPQLEILENDNHGFRRMTAFNSLIELVSIEPYTYTKGKYSIELTEGQIAITKGNLANKWDCDEDTVLKVLRIFSAAGLITVVANNRTTIITIHCLAFWIVNVEEKTIKNRHYVRNPKVEEYKPAKRSKTGKLDSDELPTVTVEVQQKQVAKVECESQEKGKPSNVSDNQTNESPNGSISYSQRTSADTESTTETHPYPSIVKSNAPLSSNHQSRNQQSFHSANTKQSRQSLADRMNGKGFGSRSKQ